MTRLPSLDRIPRPGGTTRGGEDNLPESGHELLWRYTRDHWAAAAAGTALARRLWQENVDTPWGHQLERIYHEISDDEATLTALRRRLGHPGGKVRRALALTGERAGRLKLNGRLTSYSPLSRVEETEALLVGVRAKQLLWSAMETALGPTVAGVDLSRMAGRADSQAATLTELHRWATTEAFQPAPDPDRPLSSAGRPAPTTATATLRAPGVGASTPAPAGSPGPPPSGHGAV